MSIVRGEQLVRVLAHYGIGGMLNGSNVIVPIDGLADIDSLETDLDLLKRLTAAVRGGAVGTNALIAALISQIEDLKKAKNWINKDA